MTTGVSIDKLTRDLREIFRQDSGNPEPAMESFLEGELKDLDLSARIEVLGRLKRVFSPSGPDAREGSDRDSPAGLVSLLLGIDVSGTEAGGPETLNRLAESLNTIFNALNELIGLINLSLGGGVGEETIRHIIGSNIEGETKVQSIEEYLSRIRKAFLTAQESSKEASRTIAGRILAELDPKGLESSIKGFRLGTMKKAEAFELFEEKYDRIMRWYDSDRFLLDFLREFEKNCRKSYTKTGGEE